MDTVIGFAALVGFGLLVWAYGYGVSALLTWIEKCVRNCLRRRKETKLP